MVQYRYDAWGGIRTEVKDEDHAAIAELNPFRYRSYYYDKETHLYYLNTRYYDPETGRFISQDDVSYLDPEHINGLNLFAYCGNNPVMNVDPNGTFAITALLIGLIVGAIVGAIVGGTVAGCVASSNGAEGWELFGWIMLGVFGGAVIGGAIGAGLGAAAGVIFPGINAALAGSMSFTIPTLMNVGGALAIGSATVAVPVGALAAAGAAAVGVGVGTGLSVSMMRIGKSGGYKIDHHYPDDHYPPHVHISGDDGMTKIDIFGNPIKGARPMTAGEKKAFEALYDRIMETLSKWFVNLGG